MQRMEGFDDKWEHRGSDGMNVTERRLYHALKRIGLNPEPQYKISDMTVDFAFPDNSLAIEINGPYHKSEAQSDTDKKRYFVLKSEGWELKTFSAKKTYWYPEKVALEIKDKLAYLTDPSYEPMSDSIGFGSGSASDITGVTYSGDNVSTSGSKVAGWFIFILIIVGICYGLSRVNYFESFGSALDLGKDKITSLFAFEPADEQESNDVQSKLDTSPTTATKNSDKTTTPEQTTTTIETKKEPYELSVDRYSIVITNNLEQRIDLLIKYRRYSNWFGIDDEVELEVEVAPLGKKTIVDPKFQANDGCSHAPCQIIIISHEKLD